MNTTQTPTTTAAGSVSLPCSRRRWRHTLIFLAAFAATVALFYAEEDWRGRRAWENCKRDLEAKGAKLDRAYYIPPPVPDEQNSFGVPEMQRWFVGRGPSELAKKFTFPGWTNSARITVANVMIGLPGAVPPSDCVVLQWTDAKNARAEAARLMNRALGPMASDPIGYPVMIKKQEEVRPCQIFLQCQTAPTLKEVRQFLPKSFNPRPDWLYEGDEDVKIEPAGANSYRETMRAPVYAADYTAWGATIEPELSIIRQAAQRPYARMAGDYSFLPDIPIPQFVSLRIVSQRLAALAECYMLLGQPERALDELTLIHQLCRLTEARPTGKPMTLLAAMINVAVTQLYVETIEDGIRMRVWSGTQLAALQEQLQEINLRPYVVDGIALQQASTCEFAEMAPRAKLMEIFKTSEKPIKNTKLAFFSWLFNSLTSEVSYYPVMPRGWVYQNMVVNANLHQIINDSMESADQLVEPRKLDSVEPMMEREYAHWSPFHLLINIATPNVSRAFQTTSRIQTKVNQGQIACALERYRLARGEYPSTLEALVPGFIEKIPHDLIGGQPPHYHRADDGKFVLYSIGWTETDHGGKSASNGKDGDWVWMDEALANSPAGADQGKPSTLTVAPPFPPSMNSNLTAGNDILQTVALDQVPVSDAVAELAKQTKVKIRFDPVIVNQKAADGALILSLKLSAKWNKVTAWQALQALLDNFGWQMIVTPGPSILVAAKDTNAIGPLEIPVNLLENSATNRTAATGNPTDYFAFDEVPLGEAIRQMALKAELNIQFDPRLAGQQGVRVTEKWKNLTARQALQALLDVNGWQITQIPGNPIFRVVPKNPGVPDPALPPAGPK